jgi:hypothetical protein
MPRFNADVQKTKNQRSRHHEYPKHHREQEARTKQELIAANVKLLID